MNEPSAASAASVVKIAPCPGAAAPKRIKIGAVARHFGVSVDLLRLYEREGLLIPLKSPKGTRYFTELDYPWIDTLAAPGPRGAPELRRNPASSCPASLLGDPRLRGEPQARMQHHCRFRRALLDASRLLPARKLLQLCGLPCGVPSAKTLRRSSSTTSLNGRSSGLEHCVERNKRPRGTGPL